jgi:hypothetical protein
MTTRLIGAFFVLFGLVASADAQPRIFTGSLDGLQEDPDVTTNGTGTGIATFDPATNMLSVSVTFADLTGTTTDSHIHCCFNDGANPPVPNAGVALGFTPGFPLGVTSGTFNATYDLLNPSVYRAAFLNGPGGGTAAGARDALLAGMANAGPDGPRAYFNIHTGFRGGGEIRGNISEVPEPSTWAMLSVGGLFLAYRARRAAVRRARAEA